MIVGFEKGFIVCISAHPSEMGQVRIPELLLIWNVIEVFVANVVFQEIFSVAEYKTYLAAVAANQPFGKILTVGDHQCVFLSRCSLLVEIVKGFRIKVREMRELSDIFVIMEVDTEKGWWYF